MTLYMQLLVLLVPMLAPLVDQMSCHIQRRFTALQALQFFDKHSIPEVLLLPSSISGPNLLYDESDRWSQLPDDFVRHFREPKLPRKTKLLRLGHATVVSIRRIKQVGIKNVGLPRESVIVEMTRSCRCRLVRWTSIKADILPFFLLCSQNVGLAY